MSSIASLKAALGAIVAVLVMLIAMPAVAQDSAASAQDGMPTAEAQLLVDILRDDAKRAALIEQLERADATTTEPVAAPPPPESLSRQIAEFTKATAENAMQSFAAITDQLSRAPDIFNTLSADQIAILIDALQAMALVIVVTTVVYLALRWRAKRLYRSMGDTTADAAFGRTLVVLIASALIDALLVVIAWAAGYLAALIFTGETGEIGVRQSLYLNAFLIVGMVRVAIRTILSPTTAELRFVSIPDSGAQMMARWFGVIATVLGYGQLLLVPIVNRQVSDDAGRGVSTLAALIAILIAVGMVIRGRRAVAAWMIGEDAEEKRGITRFLARNWNIPVFIYLFALFLVVATRPDGVIWPVLITSAKVLGALVMGVLISGAITRSSARGVHVPQSVRMRLPLLERRLNTFVPRALLLVRMVIIVVVVAVALDAIGVVDVSAWLDGEVGVRLTGTLASVVMMLLLSFAIWLGLSSWVDYRLNPEFGSAPTARETTLLSLLKNAATIVLIVITMMFVLSEIGIDIAPLIASAGVLGLAIGFGAQKMVQDIITGIFIQFENAMNVGDVVTLGGITGTVERLTIRSVSLRDLEGAFHIIPFSSVDMVSNYMRDYGNFVCDMGIGYRENVEEAKQAMHDAFDVLRQDPAMDANILGDLQWFGVQSLGDNAVVLRARIKCMPGAQWATGRAYNEICKRIFDERDIEIPFPHQTIYFGVDKKGEAPPMRMQVERAVTTE